MEVPMKLFIPLMIAVLLGGCASTGSNETTGATGSNRSADLGQWQVGCLLEDTKYLAQCKAELTGHVQQFLGDEAFRPTPLLWISWIKGEDPDKRTVCVLGHNYPAVSVGFRIDKYPELQLIAASASGCFIANQEFINQIRKGRQLVVRMNRFPWGETHIGFDLHRSNRALDELRRLVKSQ
jgi:hypothetical protein